jgi:hypothetical protein
VYLQSNKSHNLNYLTFLIIMLTKTQLQFIDLLTNQTICHQTKKIFIVNHNLMFHLNINQHLNHQHHSKCLEGNHKLKLQPPILHLIILIQINTDLKPPMFHQPRAMFHKPKPMFHKPKPTFHKTNILHKGNRPILLQHNSIFLLLIII